MGIEAFGLSEIGPVRRINEDCFISALDLQLFLVADGMGGHAAGEVASRLAAESIENFIRRSQDTTDFSWPYGIDARLSYEGNRLKTAVNLGNRRIHRLAENHDDYLGMGTTVVCVLLAGNQMIVAHVGDSRLYVFAEGTLTQLTEDDSWAATVLGGGTPRNRPQSMRHVLTIALGARGDTEVHLAERVMMGTETLLLCSDGLHGSVPGELLHQLLASDQPVPQLVHTLIATALEQGSRDNITALVVRYSGTE
jgi:serine/threonine protein phosphatase PrpC